MTQKTHDTIYEEQSRPEFDSVHSGEIEPQAELLIADSKIKDRIIRVPLVEPPKEYGKNFYEDWMWRKAQRNPEAFAIIKYQAGISERLNDKNIRFGSEERWQLLHDGKVLDDYLEELLVDNNAIGNVPLLSTVDSPDVDTPDLQKAS